MSNTGNESAYLDLLSRILSTGDEHENRTGIDTIRLHHETLRLNLMHQNQSTFPLLTTRRIYWTGVYEELFWMLRGETNANILNDRGVKIWNANATREFLDSRGLTGNAPGDLGPVYGFQWRHFGGSGHIAPHHDTRSSPGNGPGSDPGVDQIKYLVDEIRNNPGSRRLVLSAWNPVDLPKMALPPCHYSAMFSVSGLAPHGLEKSGGIQNEKPRGQLHCSVIMRSTDVVLGLPFNMASYALLTHILAEITGLTPGILTIFMNDAHIYKTHIPGVREQLLRKPSPGPKLSVTGIDIFNPDPNKLVLTGYTPEPNIKFEMVA